MLETYGLTHIALKVKDLSKSVQFYQSLFGCRIMYRTDDFIQIQTPGSHDIIVLEKTEEAVTQSSGILHFGFRLRQKESVTHLKNAVVQAGGAIKKSGEFVPDEPYVFIFDPDGYEIEIWYEALPPELETFN